MSTIPAPGDRVRRVVYDVNIDGVSHRAVRTFAWSEALPEHMCVASDCETCTEGVVRSVTRRLGDGVGKAEIVVTAIRDHQDVAR